jgi:hypothetical protein
VTTKGDLLVASADKAISRVAVGADTRRLVADSTQGNGVRWAAETEQTLVDAKGDLIVGTADNTGARLAVGANDTRIVADSGQATGLRYAPDTENKLVAAKGDLLAGTANDTVAVLTAGANDTRLVADSTQATGLRYAPDTENKLIAAKGDLLAGSANDTLVVLTVAANDRRLVADSTQASGLRYAPDTELKLVDAKGDLLVGTADNTLARLAVGADRALLVADSASAGGMKWNVGALPTWVPVVTQGVNVTNTGIGNFTRNGRMVTAEFFLTVTGAGTASNVITVTLPVNADAAWILDYGTHGTAVMHDFTATWIYPCQIVLGTATTMKFRLTGGINPAFFLGVDTFTAGLAVSDVISGTVTYPAAAD